MCNIRDAQCCLFDFFFCQAFIIVNIPTSENYAEMCNALSTSYYIKNFSTGH